MTEGDGGTRKNIRDEMEEATDTSGGKRKKEKVEEAARESTSGSSGGVKDNVQDDWRRSQDR